MTQVQTTKAGRKIVWINGERFIHSPAKGMDKQRRNTWMRAYRKRRLAERHAMVALLDGEATTTAAATVVAAATATAVVLDDPAGVLNVPADDTATH